MTDIIQEIKDDIAANEVVLFMKGTEDMPMCGFSSVVVQILQRLGVDFKDINVLDDQDIRQGIKDFSDWPTIPQLYVKGEFIGGCDIVKEMYGTGELLDMFKENNITTQG